MSIERPKPSGHPIDSSAASRTDAAATGEAGASGSLAAATKSSATDSSSALDSSTAVHGATATQDAARNAEIAEGLRSGRLDAAAAQARLIEETVDQLAPGATEQQKAALRELLSASLGTDPRLAALLDAKR